MNKPTAAKATTNTCRNDPESRETNGTPKVEWFGFETNREAVVVTPTFSNQLPAFHRWTSPSRVHSNIPSSSWHNYSAADRTQTLLTSLPQMVSPKSRETIGRIFVDSIIIRKLQQRPNDLRAWPCTSTDPKTHQLQQNAAYHDVTKKVQCSQVCKNSNCAFTFDVRT